MGFVRFIITPFCTGPAASKSSFRWATCPDADVGCWRVDGAKYFGAVGFTTAVVALAAIQALIFSMIAFPSAGTAVEIGIGGQTARLNVSGVAYSDAAAMHARFAATNAALFCGVPGAINGRQMRLVERRLGGELFAIHVLRALVT